MTFFWALRFFFHQFCNNFNYKNMTCHTLECNLQTCQVLQPILFYIWKLISAEQKTIQIDCPFFSKKCCRCNTWIHCHVRNKFSTKVSYYKITQTPDFEFYYHLSCGWRCYVQHNEYTKNKEFSR